MTFTEEQSHEIQRFVDAILKSADNGTMINLVFSGGNAPDHTKIKGKLCLIRGTRMLQLEHIYSEGRVAQENVALTSVNNTVKAYFGDAFRRVDLNDAGGAASLMMSKKGKVTAVVPGSLMTSFQTALRTDIMAAFGQNNREKNRLLRGNEPFLVALGISDKNGRVHDKKQSKFRQICRFSEIVMEEVRHLPSEGVLRVADLCCGKSYLSFAVYHCLTAIAGREVQMICMDLKQSVMDFCADIAKKLHYDGMRFLCGNIAEYKPDAPPDMVLSLHACDTATDIVLSYATALRAAVILSTPCCQRQLSKDLDCAPLSFLADRPVLRRKFCDAATDALRLLFLESEGYRADALEFIDPEDTPKNVMLRATRKKQYNYASKAAQEKREEYRAAYRFLTGTDPVLFRDTQKR